MPFSRREFYVWLETASNEQLKEKLDRMERYMVTTNDKDDIATLILLITKTREEMEARGL